jgi:hypothetical protein
MFRLKAVARVLLLASALSGLYCTVNAQTVALVSAVGDQFTFVREVGSTGTSVIDTAKRQKVASNGKGLDYAVLRGLEKALTVTEPNAKAEFVVLRVPDIENDTGSERERKSLVALTDLLRAEPARKGWDKIIAVLPSYQFSSFQGMGSKLNGIGVYVQPIEKERYDFDGSGGAISSTAADGDDVTYGPDGKRTERKYTTYVAPYFFVRVVTLDAKTMAVISDERKLEYRKFFDPESTAIDVQKQFAPEQLAGLVEKFVERASREAVAGKGVVELGDTKVLPKQ